MQIACRQRRACRSKFSSTQVQPMALTLEAVAVTFDMYPCWDKSVMLVAAMPEANSIVP